MSLEKASFINLDKNERHAVLFNPREYTLRKSTHWEQHRSPGRDAPAIEFTSGHSMILSLELFFDTYESDQDVRAHTRPILALASVDGSLRRPPRVLFAWGGFKFEGVLEEVSQRFTMFTRAGLPVRATLQLSLREYRRPLPRPERGEAAGPAMKTRTLRQGESLSLIASEEYGDPAEWRRIAEASGILDPKEVPPGTALKIPPRL